MLAPKPGSFIRDPGRQMDAARQTPVLALAGGLAA
jgi:hypothetical protein